MALYPNPQELEKYNGVVGKTHTNLVVSEGAAPAERLLVSKTNVSTPFIYEYGPEGNQTVLIAKGKIVEAVGEELDREQGHTATAIRVAEEDSVRAIGVNHHNVYDQRRGAMEGNRPTVITRNLIEVPLFEHDNAGLAAESAKAMHFGAAYGATGELKSGDFVTVGLDGNFKKYTGTDAKAIVGQVWNVNRELPPSGLLQYYTGLKGSEMDDYMKMISAVPGAVDSIKPYGAPYTVGSWRKAFAEALAGGKTTGIPFLTDGYFSSLQQIKAVINTDDVEAVRAGDKASVQTTVITLEAGTIETMVAVKLKNKIDPRSLDSVVVTYNAGATDGTLTTVGKRDIKVDAKNNTVVVYLDGAETAVEVHNLTVEYKASVDPIAGVPTEWDYEGSVGAARILLQR